MTVPTLLRRFAGAILVTLTLGAVAADAGPLRDIKRNLGFGGGGDKASAGTQASAGGGGRAAGAVETRVVTIGGMERTYHVYVPASAGQRAPLVMALHGGGGNGLRFAQRIGLTSMADRYGYVAVIPEGVGRGRNGASWNADSVVRQGYAETERVDDVSFLTTVIDAMRNEASIDPRRVYLMGLSKGGMMAYRLACAIPARVSAIAAVASVMSTDKCAGGADVSVLHIHGTADENVPFEGGRGRLTGGNAVYPPVNAGIQAFSGANSCSAPQPPVKVASDTACEIRSCSGQDQVTLCMVEGGGHAWPGTKPARWQKRENVYVSPNFDATTYIAEFFQNH